MANLYNVDSPINREQRNNINATFADIQSRFSRLSYEIGILSGGGDVDELLQRIENTITQAQADIQNSITTNDAALTNALNDISTQLAVLMQKIDEANIAITNTNSARDAALLAAQELQNFINSFNHKGDYSAFTQYYKNNEVLFSGSTYRAKVDNSNSPPPSTLGQSNDNWQLIARRGTDSATSNVSILRSATPPLDTSLIWFEDPDFVGQQIIQIFAGIAPPADTSALWLQERGI